ncbi:MAG: hypothetical protein ISP16_03870 [Candidatus Aquiluna sp.]|nr:hypothetical protein [Aquiluna sp.]
MAMQALVLWALGVQAILAFVAGSVTSTTSSLFLIGLILGAAIFATNVGVGLWKLRRWAHTPALMLQLLGAAIGTASFSGEFAEPLIGVSLLASSALGFVLLFGGGIRSLFHSATD